jgi:Protein of unknown function (DUF3300)
MKTRYRSRVIVWFLVLSLVLPLPLSVQAQDEGAAPPPRIYSQEELDRLLAPIALYPDTLLSQVLMAATYPLEVVEADRWLKQNKGLSVDALDKALQEKPWDVSVKSLCHYPTVLATMSEKLEQTTDLGNAFLGQQDQVMNTIQSLRAKAQSKGNLPTTDKQKISYQEGAIAIEPVQPEVVYVPAYDPCWVYGPWWYPTCAPLWFWYPGIVIGAGFFFGPAIFIGPLDFWCGFRWGRHQIFVNVNKTFVVHRGGFTRMHGGVEAWVHDPVHRRGVAYHNAQTASRFGQSQRPGVEARRQFRGFAPQGRGTGLGAGSPGRLDTGRPMMQSPGRSGMGSPIARPQSIAPATRPVTPPQTGHAFEGMGSSGREVMQHGERGHTSIGGSSSGGRVGGGVRGGGGFRR